MSAPTPMSIAGARLHPGLLTPSAQKAMLEDVREIVRAAPLFTPVTPGGRPMRVRMTSAGRYGWCSDRRGYRYESRHPAGGAWPPIPRSILDTWFAVSGTDRLPDCCLVNHYAEDARMGLHQDRDEADFAYPVVSISLGATATFRIGGTRRQDPTRSFPLASGDVLVLEGPARLAFHGVDRIRKGPNPLTPGGGRINLTLRVVD
ncbi:MAG: alpha-ketoglutarate-dependent dioxygenase AlkB family protein [Rubricella sp.]